MGHAAKTDTFRCDVLDELEAAITLRQDIRVDMTDGLSRSGRPIDLYTENHEDFLKLENHLPIAVSMIVGVHRL